MPIAVLIGRRRFRKPQDKVPQIKTGAAAHHRKNAPAGNPVNGVHRKMDKIPGVELFAEIPNIDKVMGRPRRFCRTRWARTVPELRANQGA